MTATRVVQASGSVGAIQFQSGSGEFQGDARLTWLTGSNEFIITGSAEFTAGSNIGPAEDGSYIDGLFTDFTDSTTVGTAVDRFNEVLKSLAAIAPHCNE